MPKQELTIEHLRDQAFIVRGEEWIEVNIVNGALVVTANSNLKSEHDVPVCTIDADGNITIKGG